METMMGSGAQIKGVQSKAERREFKTDSSRTSSDFFLFLSLILVNLSLSLISLLQTLNQNKKLVGDELSTGDLEQSLYYNMQTRTISVQSLYHKRGVVDEDLRKSLENLKKQEDKGASGPQAIALLVAASNHSNETVDNQNSTAGESRQNKVVFTEMEEFVWGLQIDEEARKLEGEDVFMHDDQDEAGGWTQVQQPNSQDKEVIVPDESIHEVALGKGLSGALKLLKDRGTLKETIEWGGRNMDKKKSKLVGIVEDEGKQVHNKKEIHIQRTDEFGRILTPKEAFRRFSHEFHGKQPGKMKQEMRRKQYNKELKLKQMKSSDTPSLSVERMREAQALTKTPYLVLSGHVKPGQTSDPESGFSTVEKDLPGRMTPMLGDPKVEHFLRVKRKAEKSKDQMPQKRRTGRLDTRLV